MKRKVLYRTEGDKRMIAGVLGGFGEYFGVDANVLRVLYVFFLLITGVFPGVIAYIIAIFLMPLESDVVRVHEVDGDEGAH